jgi:hypothetical protein
MPIFGGIILAFCQDEYVVLIGDRGGTGGLQPGQGRLSISKICKQVHLRLTEIYSLGID